MKIETLRGFTKGQIRDMLISCDNQTVRVGLLKIYDTFEDEAISFVYMISESELERVRSEETK